jgi:hypothetical protein
VMAGFIVYFISHFGKRQQESREEYKTFGLAGLWASLVVLFVFLGFSAFYPQSFTSSKMETGSLGALLKYFPESNTYAACHLLFFSLMALFGFLLLFFQARNFRSIFPYLVSISVIAYIVAVFLFYIPMERKVQAIQRITYEEEKKKRSLARTYFDKRCKEDAGYETYNSIYEPQDGIAISDAWLFKENNRVLHTLIGPLGTYKDAYPVKTEFRLRFVEMGSYRYLPTNENPGKLLRLDINANTMRSRYRLQLEYSVPQYGVNKNHWSLIDQKTGKKMAERIRYEYDVPGQICPTQENATKRCIQIEPISLRCPEGGEAEDVDWLLGILQAKKN